MFDNTQPSAAAPAAEAENTAPETETVTVTANPTEPAAAVVTDEMHDNPERHPTADEVEAATAAEEAASAEAMDKLLDQYAAPPAERQEDKMIEGRVVAIQEAGVVVDLGGKFEGLIPAQEFADASTELHLAPGETVEVFLLDEHKDGYRLLSYLRALRKRIWENIEKSFREKLVLSGKVVDRIKGGVVVDIGIPAFMPASQTDVRPMGDVTPWLNQEISVRVIKMNRKRGNVVVSRRALMEEEVAEKRAKLLETLSEGAILKGVVKNMTDYGAFVDLGGMDGLLHVTDISWSRVAKPADALTAGQEVEVIILKFDKEKNRISLGMKQLKPDPWGGLLDRFPVGSQHKGRVSGVTDYGCFVEVEPGVEGLAHVSEMSWSKRPKHPTKLVSVGDMVDVKVLNLNAETRRISLSIKQTTEDPWHAFAAKYKAGTIVKGTVRNLTDFGAFLEIEEGFDGLIHVSDISWTERVKNPSDKFKKGDEVEAKVLKIDGENRRLSLGIKQINDIWAGWFDSHKVEDVVRGKVMRAAEFGVFVELAEGIEALCHKTEIESRRDREDREKGKAKGPAVSLEVGQEYDFKIVKISRDQHKIGLSFRAAARAAERKEMAEYKSTSKSSSKFTIGDMILSKRNSK